MAICECGRCGLDAGVYKTTAKGHKEGEPKRFLLGHSGCKEKVFCVRGHARTPDNVLKNRACRACVPFHKMMKYGITPEQKSEMLVKQDNCCAICKDVFSITSNVDHAHDKGRRVRGLLCRPCNVLLGAAKDDPTILTNAIQYLKETQCPTQQQPTLSVFSLTEQIHMGSEKSLAMGSLFLKQAATV